MFFEVRGKSVEQAVGSRFRWHDVRQSLSGDELVVEFEFVDVLLDFWAVCILLALG